MKHRNPVIYYFTLRSHPPFSTFQLSPPRNAHLGSRPPRAGELNSSTEKKKGISGDTNGNYTNLERGRQ